MLDCLGLRHARPIWHGRTQVWLLPTCVSIIALRAVGYDAVRARKAMDRESRARRVESDRQRRLVFTLGSFGATVSLSPIKQEERQ